MIKTCAKIQEWQKERGVELIRTGMEEVGVRYLKAEPLLSLARLHVETKTDYEHISNGWDYAPVAIVPRENRNTVKVAYADKWGYNGYLIQEILHKKNWDNADDVTTYSYDYGNDRGRNDDRYHVFRATDMELIIENPPNTDVDITGIVLFRDIDTGREFLAKGTIVMYRR